MKNKIFLVLFIGVALTLSACATSGNLPRPMVIDNSPPPNVSQKAEAAATNPTALKPFKMEMLNEKPAKAPASVAIEQPTSISQSVETRISRLEAEVKKHGTLLAAHQKILLKHKKRIEWLEAYQRKMDARLAELTWNGMDNDLSPIRLYGFAPGSAAPTARCRIQAKATLKRLLKIGQEAKAQGKTMYVDVLGYASADGSAKKNQLLSFERAKAVAKIIKKGGISVVSVKGMGETNAGLYGSTNRCVRILTRIK